MDKFQLTSQNGGRAQKHSLISIRLLSGAVVENDTFEAVVNSGSRLRSLVFGRPSSDERCGVDVADA